MKTLLISQRLIMIQAKLITGHGQQAKRYLESGETLTGCTRGRDAESFGIMLRQTRGDSKSDLYGVEGGKA